MIREYALVSPEGEILARRDLNEDTVGAVAPGKARYLPVEYEPEPAYNPAVEVLEGPAPVVQATRVVIVYTVRPMAVGEIGDLKAAKRAAISTVFAARTFAPISVAVGGVTKIWDADRVARDRIANALALIARGRMASPRAWTAYGELTATSVTEGDLENIAVAIAEREDALFVVKKTKEWQLSGLTTALQVAGFNSDAGWV